MTDQYLPIETVFDRQLDMVSKQKEICMLNGPLRMIPWSSATAFSGGWISVIYDIVCDFMIKMKCTGFFFRFSCYAEGGK